MITAQEARDLVMTKEDISSALAALEEKITEAATAGLFVTESEENGTLGAQLAAILVGLGYDARYESARHTLKVKWS